MKKDTEKRIINGQFTPLEYNWFKLMGYHNGIKITLNEIVLLSIMNDLSQGKPCFAMNEHLAEILNTKVGNVKGWHKKLRDTELVKATYKYSGGKVVGRTTYIQWEKIHELCGTAKQNKDEEYDVPQDIPEVPKLESDEQKIYIIGCIKEYVDENYPDVELDYSENKIYGWIDDLPQNAKNDMIDMNPDEQVKYLTYNYIYEDCRLFTVFN